MLPATPGCQNQAPGVPATTSLDILRFQGGSLITLRKYLFSRKLENCVAKLVTAAIPNEEILTAISYLPCREVYAEQKLAQNQSFIIPQTNTHSFHSRGRHHHKSVSSTFFSAIQHSSLLPAKFQYIQQPPKACDSSRTPATAQGGGAGLAGLMSFPTTSKLLN